MCRCARLAIIARRRSCRHGFTLVELLVVIGIIALLLGFLMPVLSKARRAGMTTKCLSNMRNMQLAHWMYIGENHGYLITAGFSHGGHTLDPGVAWFNTLQTYYNNKLLVRCPADDSRYWDQPITPGGALRQTSYGINDFLDPALVPWGGPYVKITQVRRPSATIQFLEMAYEGEFAVADHVHVENWTGLNPPALAGTQVQIGAHGGRPKTWESTANWGFLDGHAETAPFRTVFTNFQHNRFDPAIAQ